MYVYIYIYINLNKCTKDVKCGKCGSASLYKKDGRKEKSNYRPVSILSNVSKVYKRCLYDQIYDFFENKFSRYQCGFRGRKMLSMVEKCFVGQYLLICQKLLTASVMI